MRVKHFPEFHIYVWPCPIHKKSSANNAGVCRECKRLYKNMYRRKFGMTIRARFVLAKRSAERRGIEWKLTFKQYRNKVVMPCVYGVWAGEPRENLRMGVDRRDNSEGYTGANSQACCYRHNRFKSDILTHDQTLDAVERYGIECGNASERGTR
jgi:hypothetical protein